MPVTTCVAAEGSILVPQMPQAFHIAVPYLAEEHAIESANILGAGVVLDAESAGLADPEALSCESENGLLLVSAIPTAFAATTSHPWRNGANG